MKNRAVHPGNCWWVPPRIPQSTCSPVHRMARILAARHANVVRAIDLFTLDVLRHPRQPWTNEKTRQCMMSVWPTWDVISWHDWQSKVLFSVRIYWVSALDRTGAVRRIDGLYRAGIDALYLVILRYWYFKEGGGWASAKIGLEWVRSISLHALFVLDPSLLTTTCNTLKNVTNLQSFGSSCLSVLSIVLDIFLYSYAYSFLDI